MEVKEWWVECRVAVVVEMEVEVEVEAMVEMVIEVGAAKGNVACVGSIFTLFWCGGQVVVSRVYLLFIDWQEWDVMPLFSASRHSLLPPTGHMPSCFSTNSRMAWSSCGLNSVRLLIVTVQGAKKFKS